MSLVAYALREEFAGTVLQREDEGDAGTEVPAFTGGLINAGDRDLNIGELLEENDGVIVVDDRDNAAILSLDEYPALKRTKVPKGAEAIVGSGPYDEVNVDALRVDARKRGLEGGQSASKPTLIAALEEHDRRLAKASATGEGTGTSKVDVLATAAGTEPTADTGDQGTGGDTAVRVNVTPADGLETTKPGTTLKVEQGLAAGELVKAAAVDLGVADATDLELVRDGSPVAGDSPLENLENLETLELRKAAPASAGNDDQGGNA